MTKNSTSRRAYALRVANGAPPSRRGEFTRLAIVATIAIAIIATGAAHLPMAAAVMSNNAATVVTIPRLEPVIVSAGHLIVESGKVAPAAARSVRKSSFVPAISNALRATAREAILMRHGLLPHIPSKFTRAEVGEEVPVSLTRYCLKGETRRGRQVRPGIVAADPRIFPLARYVEVYLGDKYLGRYLVDDTGGNVLGATLDIWTESCHDAARFGRRNGKAILVARGEETAPPPVVPAALDSIAKR